MSYQITIRRVSNAFILDWTDEIKEEAAYSFDDSETDTEEKKALLATLWNVIEFFNLQYQKHHQPGSKFIKLELVDADKYWSDDEGIV